MQSSLSHLRQSQGLKANMVEEIRKAVSDKNDQSWHLAPKIPSIAMLGVESVTQIC